MTAETPHAENAGKAGGQRTTGGDRILGIALIPVAFVFDLASYLLWKILHFVVPVILLAVGAYLLVGLFLDREMDSSTVSGTISALLVALAALGFGWADAITKDDKDFKLVLALSKRLMLSGLALILATGFKFVVAKANPAAHFSWAGGVVHGFLNFLVACFFVQAYLEAIFPILKLHELLSERRAYKLASGLIKKHLPGFHGKLDTFLHEENGGPDMENRK